MKAQDFFKEQKEHSFPALIVAWCMACGLVLGLLAVAADSREIHEIADFLSYVQVKEPVGTRQSQRKITGVSLHWLAVLRSVIVQGYSPTQSQT